MQISGAARGYQELLASLATCRSPGYDRADSRTGFMFNIAVCADVLLCRGQGVSQRGRVSVC